jgi:hypothetical protein
MIRAEGRALGKESQRHSPLKLVKDHPWMTSEIEHLSYYNISIHGVDKPIIL